jgi:hypothetical protein
LTAVKSEETREEGKKKKERNKKYGTEYSK